VSVSMGHSLNNYNLVKDADFFVQKDTSKQAGHGRSSVHSDIKAG